MSKKSYRQTLSALRAERQACIMKRVHLERRIELVDRRIHQIEGAITNLNIVLGGTEPFEGSLADACRRIVIAATEPLTPMQVRDQLKVIGYDMTHHTNIMASVHSVLKRLAEAAFVDRVETPQGQAYRVAPLWRGGVKERDLQAALLPQMEEPEE